ncbi:uncharacterized protein OCT59_006951 [Rhizophagus irregularis]|uniref:Uncharacterized protein n=1 Tax=Rhizophagus irregularis (strain DAOM 197198w) TaxID=1432141 RepID=A0A015I6W4_RHIIW|nr:hypothetical protein RirG_249840 [Rhizophagus irregularis DAOM 197198w]UZO15532.1 hypothetical protein OCT59_006951 [Rhizophagus irregularis]GBC32595.1 hypothetical protein GLOIN_2v1781762 [Rhizophagus irregularis DAOM 181602=DAOM 197198]
MEPTTTNTKKGIATTRMYYKEYKNLEFDAARTPQQIKRWNRLKNMIIRSEEHLTRPKPFLVKDRSNVYKNCNTWWNETR